jgi:3-oxoacyl-[acyl-carrier protein] reductase
VSPAAEAPRRANPFDLTGRTAVVTGANTGLGQAISVALAEAGASVVGVGRSAMDETERLCREAGARFHAVHADLSTLEPVERIVSESAAFGGRVDILVNNAGITRDTLMLRMKRGDWDDVLATNLTSAFTTAQAVLRPMIKQRGGRIISISSVVGQTGNAGQANYAASKAGLIGFSKALAREVASRNITVNVVTPGLIATDMTKAISDKAQDDWAAAIPLGRLGTPADVAAAVCFLASDEASYITGQVLAVNGGMYM